MISPFSQTTRNVSAYDILADSWSRDPIPTRFPRASSNLTGAVVGTKIYVVGRDNNLDIYDTETNEWTVGPYPLRRDPVGAIAVAHGGSVYVFGGQGSVEVDRLNFPALDWTPLPAMSEPRSYPAVAAIGNEIHLFGGFDPSDNPLNLHEYLVIP